MIDSQSLAQQLKGDTGRLAATYLLIIMVLTLVFSGIIYSISASQFDRPFPARGTSGQMSNLDDTVRSSFEHLLEIRAQQARAELFASLVLLNLAVLIGGMFVSYYLARMTLRPIEEAMQSQARFVSDASHELRTPLTALQITNEVALRKKRLTLDQAKELIGHNLAETIKLRTLSESLLGLAHQESADTAVTEFSVEEQVRNVTETLAPLAAQRHITVVTDMRAHSLRANKAAITQVLSVFTDNAIKYAPENSRVTVAGHQVGAEYQLSVHDDGPAIPPRYHNDIFERFYRIDESRSSQNTQGTGLGLSIARAIADRHGYRISLKSAPHEGNTFILHIPTS